MVGTHSRAQFTLSDPRDAATVWSRLVEWRCDNQSIKQSISNFLKWSKGRNHCKEWPLDWKTSTDCRRQKIWKMNMFSIFEERCLLLIAYSRWNVTSHPETATGWHRFQYIVQPIGYNSVHIRPMTDCSECSKLPQTVADSIRTARHDATVLSVASGRAVWTGHKCSRRPLSLFACGGIGGKACAWTSAFYSLRLGVLQWIRSPWIIAMAGGCMGQQWVVCRHV